MVTSTEVKNQSNMSDDNVVETTWEENETIDQSTREEARLTEQTCTTSHVTG